MPRYWYCKDLRQDFEELVEELEPSDDYIREAKHAAQTVFMALQRGAFKYDLKIGRTIIAGSIGKGTGISYLDDDDDEVNPDLDLVVFVNDVVPPFPEELQIFSKILAKRRDIWDMKVKTFSIQFMIDIGGDEAIKVDLLAAGNHVVNTSRWSGQDIGKVEARFALKDLAKKQKPVIRKNKRVSQMENKLHSSAFAEQTVDIIGEKVEEDDNYVLDVVMLAKYWNVGIDLEGYFPARSCVIEMVAIHAQQKRKDTCLVSGFTRFLEAMSKFRKLDISLVKYENDGEDLGKYSKPMIRDPVNKWNNLAEGIPFRTIRVLEREANKTLKVLREVSKVERYDMYEDVIDEIFSQKN